MPKLFLTVAAGALALTSFSIGSANAQNVVAETISCSASCNSGYASCMGSGVDMSLVTNVGDVGSRTRDNMAAARMCRKEVTSCKRACYSGG